jgi:hypothetical protein
MLRILPDLMNPPELSVLPITCPLPVCLATIYKCPLPANSAPQAENSPFSIVRDLAIKRISQFYRDLSAYRCIKNPIQYTIAS